MKHLNIVWMVVFVMIALQAPVVAFARTPLEIQTDREETRAAIRDAREALRDTATQKLYDRASKEIARRITALNETITKITDIKKISAADKTSLTLVIQSQISLLTNLQTKIDADTDLATLKTDTQSITKAHRTFALVMPQIAILASADRWTTVVDSVSTIAQKLEVRIGTSTSPVLQNALIDLKANIVDAQGEIQKARDAVVGLKPDNGDEAVFTSNRKVLISARSMLKNVYKSLESARKDINTIRKNLIVQP